MWFKVIFYDHVHPIATAIGDNGNVYFKATDIGRLLGYANVYNFSYRYGITDFNTMLPSKMKRADITKKCFVFSFEEMILILQKKKHKCQTQLNVDDMIDLWINGSVDAIVPKYPSVYERYAPVLHVGRNKSLKIQDWILSYKLVLDDYLKKLKAFDYCYYEPPPSVISHPQQDDSDDMLTHQQQRVEDYNDDSMMIDDPMDLRTMPQDPRSMPQDPRSIPHDTMAAARDDDALQTSFKNNNPITEDRTTIDPEPDNQFPDRILSPEPEPLYNLKMDFEAFPPDQIFINIHNMSYRYGLIK